MLKNRTVLVLDGEARAALAVVRSLGRAGLRVIVASESVCSLAGSSRFCDHNVRCHSPFDELGLFAKNIIDLINRENAGVLIPVTDASTYAVLKYQHLFANKAAIPINSFERYWAASNKIALLKRAAQLDIPFPSTVFIDNASGQSLQQNLSKIKFPVIIKPQASIQPYGNRIRKTGVRFAKSQNELIRIISTDKSFTMPYMLQEVVSGDGIGIFAFCNEGEIICAFSHRRIREKPPWGGISVLCESTPADPLALESANKLLKALNWSGIAMVEFKRDNARNSIPVLMEINARFWGSLQLAINAGVDFPLYLYHQLQKAPLRSINSFKASKSRWLLGDLDHLLICLKTTANHPLYPQRLRDRLKAVLLFFLEFAKGSAIEELRYYDLGPFLHAIKTWRSSN